MTFIIKNAIVITFEMVHGVCLDILYAWCVCLVILYICICLHLHVVFPLVFFHRHSTVLSRHPATPPLSLSSCPCTLMRCATFHQRRQQRIPHLHRCTNKHMKTQHGQQLKKAAVIPKSHITHTLREHF